MERTVAIDDPVGDAVQKVIDDTRRAGRPWMITMFVVAIFTMCAYIALFVWYWRTAQAEIWVVFLGLLVLRRAKRTVDFICIRRLERLTGGPRHNFYDTINVVSWGIEFGMLCFVIWLALK